MSKSVGIRVPKLGDFSGIPVVEIYVKAGDMVASETPLVSLESEKAVMDIPSPSAGRIVSIEVKPGDKVSEGDLLGLLEIAGESGATDGGSSVVPEAPGPAAAIPVPAAPAVEGTQADQAAQAAQAAQAVQAASAHSAAARSAQSAPAAAPVPKTSASATPEPGKRSHASPSVRLFALELGVDLSRVQGTGPKGRIRRTDIIAAVRSAFSAPGLSGMPGTAGVPGDSGASGNAGTPGIVGAPGTPGTPGASGVPLVPASPAPLDRDVFARLGPIQVQALSRIKRISGPRLSESWRTIPHVTQTDEADITELEEMRERMNKSLAARGLKLTALAFAVRAATIALKEFPVFNSSLDVARGEFILKKYYNIGFAVATDDGLLVPSLKGTESMSLSQIAGNLALLSEKARKGKLTLDEMTGSTFTISSLGGIGGTGFTPIINPPEVAILGLSRAAMRPLWNESSGTFIPRLMLPYSLSYDHRAIDGAEGARFARRFGELMADLPGLLS